MKKSNFIFALTLTALLAGVAIFTSRATVPQTQSTLKSYFVSNAIPTQAQYAELIDTMFWYVSAIYTNSIAAKASAAQAGAAYQAAQEIVFTGTIGGVSITYTNGYNVSSVSVTNSIYSSGGNDYYTVYLTVNFTSALQGTNYIVNGSAPGQYQNHLWSVFGVPDFKPNGAWGFYYYASPTNNINNAYTVGYSNTVNSVKVRLYSGRAWTDIDGAKIKLVVQ